MISTRWSDEEKIELFEHLGANGFFHADRVLRIPIAFKLFSSLNVTTAYPPSLLLLLASTVGTVPRSFPDVSRGLSQEERAQMALFLESYLKRGEEERLAMLECYRFHCDYVADRLSRQPEVVRWLCREMNPPTEDFFVHEVNRVNRGLTD